MATQPFVLFERQSEAEEAAALLRKGNTERWEAVPYDDRSTQKWTVIKRDLTDQRFSKVDWESV
jgi:hypothetical protein